MISSIQMLSSFQIQTPFDVIRALYIAVKEQIGNKLACKDDIDNFQALLDQSFEKNFQGIKYCEKRKSLISIIKCE